MDYPDGSGNVGHRQQPPTQYSQQRPYRPQQQQQQQQQLETRQPLHRGLYAQEQSQQPIQPQSSYGSQGAGGYGTGLAYGQPQTMNMAADPRAQALEAEYLQQQQQYLQQQQLAYGNVYPPQHYGAIPTPQHQDLSYQQQLAMQGYSGIYPTVDHMVSGLPTQHIIQQGIVQQQPRVPYLQPKVGRLPADRPLIKLSLSLIDTYKHINTIYYEERDARRAARAKEKTQKTNQQPASASGQGANNNGWDDENYDYIVTPGELFFGRYKIKERIGKGSFGQVVRAEDTEQNCEVAIKIIKSKKPFLMQAKTEIELLTHLNDKDDGDQHNIGKLYHIRNDCGIQWHPTHKNLAFFLKTVRMLTHFMYRNHQCLVFEMLSLNLYELLKNTQFGGVSLNLIRKFAKQVLKSLSFLARKDVDIIHCDLKPENILLRHPKKSAIKVIDFGSSCRSNKRMYSYIQSRFYRSPEVMLGLPYTTSIDMWSLGCILAEMHTGEPLFSGSDQVDQMQKIVKILGMVPSGMVEKADDQHRLQFFERITNSSGREEWAVKQQTSSSRVGGVTPHDTNAVPSIDPIATLTEVIRGDTTRKKKYPVSETGNSPVNYELFVNLIHSMLAYDPLQRIKPEDALNHPFITE
jgi:dual specificity tyrosine-phosphorylation-regulated kinase 1